MTDVHEYLSAHARRVDEALDRFLSAYEGVPEGLHEALRYSLFPGGKRLRPALAMGACEAVCGAPEPALMAGCALELIHTYSLVHDDLPCMDDDAIRHGLPTRGAAPWMRYAGLVESGNARSSQTVDEVVYGAKD